MNQLIGICTTAINIILFALALINSQGETKAILQDGNPTMYYYYVFPMNEREAEAIQRQSRQQEEEEAMAITPLISTISNNETIPGNEEISTALPLAETVINIGNVFNGLFRQDVRPILSGSTALIPPGPGGNLRQSLSSIINGIAPTLQNLLFGNRNRFNFLSSLTNNNNNAATTLPPFPQTSTRPRNPDSPTLELTTRPPLPSSVKTQPPFTDYIEVASESGFYQESNPVTERRHAIIPESPYEYVQVPHPTTTAYVEIFHPTTTAYVEIPHPTTEYEPQEPEVTTGSSSSGPVSTPTVTVDQVVNHLKVVLEDANSIVTANEVSNAMGEDKKYIYVVLSPEQLKQVTGLPAAVPLGYQQLQQLEEEVAASLHLNNKNRKTTIPPPHLKLQSYYQLTNKNTKVTTSTESSASSTDLPGVKGFENEDDEEN